MKKPSLEFGVILASAGLIIVAGILGFQAIRGLGQADLLGGSALSDITNQDNGPLGYETRISKGDKLLEAGFYEEAALEYAVALKIQESADAHRKLGKAHYRLQDFEKAEAQFDRALELKPNDEHRILYAHTLIQNGKADSAKTILSQLDSESQESVYLKALTDLALNDFESAKGNFNQALSMGGTVPLTWIQGFVLAYSDFAQQQGGQNIYLKALLTKSAIDADELVLAKTLALSVLNEHADYRDVWLLLGYAELQLKDYPTAEDSFNQAKNLDGIKPETHYFLGVTLMKQEKYEEAMKSFELALLYNFKPETEVYGQLADVYSALGRNEEALEAYEYLLKRNPDSVELFIEPVQIALSILGDLDRALSLAEELSSVFPDQALSYQLLAEVRLKRGEIEQADASIETAFDLNPDLASAHLTAGQIRMAQNNRDGAMWEFKKAYELSKPGESLNVEAAQKYNALSLNEETQP